MLKKQIIISIFLLLFLFPAFTIYAAQDVDNSEGLYLGMAGEAIFIQSINNNTFNNVAGGFGLEAGWRFNKRFAGYVLIDGFNGYSGGEVNSVTGIEVAPTAKYFFIEDKNYFLTGSLGTSYLSGNQDSGNVDTFSLFVSAGIGHDFRIGNSFFIAPEAVLKLYTNQTISNRVKQAYQIKGLINVGWYF